MFWVKVRNLLRFPPINTVYYLWGAKKWCILWFGERNFILNWTKLCGILVIGSSRKERNAETHFTSITSEDDLKVDTEPWVLSASRFLPPWAMTSVWPDSCCSHMHSSSSPTAIFLSESLWELAWIVTWQSSFFHFLRQLLEISWMQDIRWAVSEI